MKRIFTLLTMLVMALGIFLSPYSASATVFSDDFSGDLSNWTAGPSHLDNYGIVGGELFIDGYGHLTGPGGWGVLQFNEQLGSSFVATWDAKITYYDYSNFVLFADAPWGFNTSPGYTDNGYLGWLDIDDPTNPLLDVMKRSGGTSLDLLNPQRDISVMPDIPEDQWVSWKVEMNMGTLQVFLDDTLYVNTYDPQFASSDYKIGLSFGEDSEGYIDNFQVTTSPAPIPEPSTMLLLGSGLIGLAGFRKKFKVKTS